MYYLRVESDNFGFVTNSIHEILDSDILISDKDYENFFHYQSSGKMFRLKRDFTNSFKCDGEQNLFDFIEEYIIEVNKKDEIVQNIEINSLLSAVNELKKEVEKLKKTKHFF